MMPCRVPVPQCARSRQLHGSVSVGADAARTAAGSFGAASPVFVLLHALVQMSGCEVRCHHVQVLGISLPLLRRDPHYFLVWPGLAAAANLSEQPHNRLMHAQQRWVLACSRRRGRGTCCLAATGRPHAASSSSSSHSRTGVPTAACRCALLCGASRKDVFWPNHCMQTMFLHGSRRSWRHCVKTWQLRCSGSRCRSRRQLHDLYGHHYSSTSSPCARKSPCAVAGRLWSKKDPLEGCAAWRRHSINAYLERFGFESPLLKAMYAATDGTSAFTGSWNDPGTGANFLLHQMVCPCSWHQVT